MSRNEQNIHFLLELIDDDNEQSASLAMAELLHSDPDMVNKKLCELQESENPRLRRRVHQLQSAIGARVIRSMLMEDLRDGSLSLLDGAIRLHLSWFDHDSYDNVAIQWQELREALCDNRPRDLGEFAAFMISRKFTNPPWNNMEPELYCIGAVLDSHFGSDLMLSVIAAQVTVQTPIPLQVVRMDLDFGVMDSFGNVLLPGENWRLIPKAQAEQVKPVPEGDLLRMITSILLLSAAATDGFRYLYTIGSAMAAATGKDSLDFLPYPFNIRA